MNKHTTHTARSSSRATHRYIHLHIPWTRKLHSKWKLQSSLPILLFLLCLRPWHKAVHPLCEAFLTWPILKLEAFFLKFKLITLPWRKTKQNIHWVYMPHFLESAGFSFTSTSHALVGSFQLLPLPPLHRSIQAIPPGFFAIYLFINFFGSRNTAIVSWMNQWTGFPGGSEGKSSACNAGDLGSIPGWGRVPGEGQPIPVLLPGKSHVCKSLVGSSPWGYKESDTTERLHINNEGKKVEVLGSLFTHHKVLNKVVT